MSTIIRKENQVFFEFRGELITKTAKGWITDQGIKFNGCKVANFVRGKATANMQEIAHVKSILNRFFGYEYSFTI